MVRSDREWPCQSLLLEHGVDGEDDHNIVEDYDDDHVDKTNHSNLFKYQVVADNIKGIFLLETHVILSSKMSRSIDMNNLQRCPPCTAIQTLRVRDLRR